MSLIRSTFVVLAILALTLLDQGLGTQVNVTLNKGVLSGTWSENVDVTKFLGVPYAAPPTGLRRFAAPDDEPSWSGLYDASSPKEICPQDLQTLKIIADITDANFNISTDVPTTTSEDCLYLNVFVPGVLDANKSLAVMVNFHDGSFQSTDLNVMDGSYLAAHGGVIVVTVNYRLGALGFYGTENYGLLDQKRSLSWVKQNIGRFGGDPNKVTIFGSGSGAFAVGLHVLSAESDGLFTKAISQGGNAFMTQFLDSNPDVISTAFTDMLPCTQGDMNCLRNLSVDQIMEAQKNLSAKGHYFTVTVDGTFLTSTPREMLANGNFGKVDYMLGFNNDAGTVLAPEIFFQMESGITEQQYEFFMRNWAYKEYQPNPEPAFRVLLFEYRMTLDKTGYTPGHLWLRNLLTASRDALASTMRTTQRLYSQHGGKVFAYYFDQTPQKATYSESLLRAPSGVEIMYLFGHFNETLSRQLIHSWSSFAVAGSPTFSSNGVTIDWPQYDPNSSAQFLSIRDGPNSTQVLQQYPERLDRRMDLWSHVLYQLGNTTVPCVQPPPTVKSTPPTVNLSQGELMGERITLEGSGFQYETFLGIPYAQPPVGTLRWKAPVAHSGWTGIRQQPNASVACPQAPPPFPLYIDPKERQDEDCLFLDVFVPYGVKHLRVKKLPVMMFIHGGGFFGGSASTYPGVKLIQKDVVYVSINYRLGVLGFLSTGDSSAPGNYGLLDQQQAIRWVKANIEKFGGDPDEITIFGDSAGGASVSCQMISPTNKGLFKRVIAESGSALASWGVSTSTTKSADKFKTVTNAFNCTGSTNDEHLDCLRKIDAYSLLRGGFTHDFTPVVDGHFLPKSPIELFRDNVTSGIALMTGTTQGEGYSMLAEGISIISDDPVEQAAFDYNYPNIVNAANKSSLSYLEELTNMYTDSLFSAPAELEAVLHSRQGGETYKYFFYHRRPFTPASTPSFVKGNHGDELVYLFWLDNNVYPREDIVMSEQIIRLWTNFVHTGNPNKGSPLSGIDWPPYTPDEPDILVLSPRLGRQGEKTVVTAEDVPELLRPKQLKFWNEVLPNLKELQMTKPCTTTSPPKNTDSPRVTLAQGELLGKRETVPDSGFPYETYLGIPYAQPPEGDLRWKAPVAHSGWTGLRQQPNESVACPQAPPSSPLTIDSTERQDEDCLFLNVFVPYGVQTLRNKKLPVMMFIHGGGFVRDSASSYPGVKLIQKDVVYVSINYRLGIFGFLSSGDSSVPGNYGLLDQQLAIKWIKANIEKFGGDPDGITIFGKSAGAGSVSCQMISPSNKGLFKRAIAQSGSVFGRWVFSSSTQSEGTFMSVAHAFNCTGSTHDERLECLRKIDAYSLPRGNYPYNFSPVVDGHFLPKTPIELYNDNVTSDIQFMTGTNQADGFSLRFGGMFRRYSNPVLQAAFEFNYPETVNAKNKSSLSFLKDLTNMVTDESFSAPAEKEALLHSRRGGETYKYFFRHRLPTTPPTTPSFVQGDHRDDLPYLFWLDAENYPIEDVVMSQQMTTLWTNFAHTGNPNKGLKPVGFEWPPYTPDEPNVLILSSSLGESGNDPVITADEDPEILRPEKLKFWNELFPSLMKLGTADQCTTSTPPTTIDPPRVVLAQGELLGMRDVTKDSGFPYEKYAGIPYGEPPVGNLRWKPPVPRSGWSGIRQAQSSNVMCPSLENFNVGEVENEDCLLLDVYVPYGVQHLRNKKLPVMVWIHGGAYTIGSKNTYTGTGLIQRDVIFVAINYRLAVLGFLSTGDSTAPGNYGLLDQQLAFKWVKANIEKFGGDPEEITIFGESAGGGSVSAHVASPTNQGLFKRAIAQSGSLLAPWSFHSRTQTEDIFTRISTDLNCTGTNHNDSLECLRKLDATTLSHLTHLLPLGSSELGPVIDGTFLPKSPEKLYMDYNATSDIDFMTGSNQGDGYGNTLDGYWYDGFTKYPMVKAAFDFQYKDIVNPDNRSSEKYQKRLANLFTDVMFSAPSDREARLQSRRGGNTYRYFFNHRPAYVPDAVPRWVQGGHADEIIYMMGYAIDPESSSFSNWKSDYSEEEKELSRQLMTLWTNFARTGNPNKGSPLSGIDWPPYTPDEPDILVLSPRLGRQGEKTVVTTEDVPELLRPKQLKFWNEVVPSLSELQMRKPCTTTSPPKNTDSPRVTLAQGELLGKRETVPDSGFPYETYLGIPYAQPPEGDLRWKAPVAHSGWTGLRQQPNESVACPQAPPPFPLAIDPKEKQDEDCLFLNVFVPYGVETLRNKKLPVMMFIHGGGFVRDSASSYPGVKLIQKDVVYVSINYRLGIFGFLSSGDSSVPGNYGLLDQQLAIKWIKANIEKFGGDPDGITIFGKSAGAGSVSCQMISPSNKGLFKRAIAQSGSVFGRWVFSSSTQSEGTFMSVAHAFNCTGSTHDERLECLRKIDAYSLPRGNYPYNFSPVVDGHFLPKTPIELYNDNVTSDIQFMTGTNQADGFSLRFGGMFRRYSNPVLQAAFEFNYPETVNAKNKSSLSFLKDLTNMVTDESFSAPAEKEALLHSRRGGETYKYFFRHRLPTTPPTTPSFVQGDHRDDLPYLFWLDAENYPIEDVVMSQQMTTLWTNFAHTGNPNKGLKPVGFEWPPYTPDEPNVLILSSSLGESGNDPVITADEDPEILRPEKLKFWNELFPSLMKLGTADQCTTSTPPTTIDPPRVVLAQGELLGMRDVTKDSGFPYEKYAGIPYGEPPVGNLRWKPPVPRSGWSGIRQAQSSNVMCPSLENFNDGEVENEDCLLLDVYVPYGVQHLRNKKLPVMVWIHGGAYTIGSKNTYTGTGLIQRDVIFVAINYRLAVLGFLSTGDSTAPGNYGLLDQQLAFKWVKANIEKFGGDPEEITIFGESAGGGSVSAHVASPTNQGLFKRAIAQSGSLLAPWSFHSRTQAEDIFTRISTDLNCTGTNHNDSLECLRKLDATTLSHLTHLLPLGSSELGPVIDGTFLPKSPEKLYMDYNATSDIDFMTGSNQGDGYGNTLDGYWYDGFTKYPMVKAAFDFQYKDIVNPDNRSSEKYQKRLANLFTDVMFSAPSDREARLQSRRGGNTYRYFFNHRPAYVPDAVPRWVQGGHADEIIYMMGYAIDPESSSFSNWKSDYSEEEKELSRQLMTLWTNFARTGNPNKGSPLSGIDWPPYTPDEPDILVLSPRLGRQGEKTVVTAEDVPELLRPKQLKFWNEVVPSLSELQMRKPCTTTSPPKNTDSPRVTLAQGELLGKRETVPDSGFPYETYLGIPYAQPPEGDLRWKAPVAHSGWTGLRQQPNESVACPQAPPPFPLAIDPKEKQDEDCLFLNVFVPYGVQTLRNKKLPVMMFIHGGGFVGGSASSYPGVKLIKKDVIYVSLNYRLGIFGFLSSGDSSVPGNYGLLDQQLAIKWIKANIEKFGGDPDEITIFGKSAGAGSVSCQMISPSNKGLFKRAIAQSGSVFGRLVLSSSTQSEGTFKSVAHAFNCTGSTHDERLECLRKIDAYSLPRGNYPYNFSPVVDGHFLPKTPIELYNDNVTSDIQFMTGTNQADGFSLRFGGMFRRYSNPVLQAAFEFNYPEIVNAKNKSSLSFLKDLTNMVTDESFSAPAEKEALLHSRRGGETYKYFFRHRLPTTPPTTPSFVQGDHRDDLPYLFWLDAENYPMEDVVISQQMTTLWTNFAHTGNPNKGLKPVGFEWPPYTPDEPNVLILSSSLGESGNDPVITADEDPEILRPEKLKFWNELFPSLMKLGTADQCTTSTPPTTIDPPRVVLAQGELLGMRDVTKDSGFPYEKYVGIPYGEPPVGNLRWKPPVPRSGWSGIRQAQSSNVTCPSMNQEHVYGDVESEDCLLLDVYVPYGVQHLRNKKLPVMVWIHGGAYALGSKNHFTGSGLIQRDVIFVAINYRLGVLGFLSTGDSTAPGNYGLLDQQLAFKWVKANIEKFGGDPEEITISGQSAGGGSVSAHVVSPTSQGLFKRAIAQSGSIFAPWSLHSRTEADEIFIKISTDLNCTGTNHHDRLECLRKLDTMTLSHLGHLFPPASVGLCPVIDGTFLPKSPEKLYMDHNVTADIDFMTGSNKDEGYGLPVEDYYDELTKEYPMVKAAFDFQYKDVVNPDNKSSETYQKRSANLLTDAMFSAPSDREARLQSRRGGNTYRYFFNHRPAFVSDTVPRWVQGGHGGEMVYMMGYAIDTESIPFPIWKSDYSEEDKELSRQLMTLWTNFARTGDPNKGLPLLDFKWPLYTVDEPNVLMLNTRLGVIGERSVIAVDDSSNILRPRELQFWNEVVPELEHMQTTQPCVTTKPPVTDIGTTESMTTVYTTQYVSNATTFNPLTSTQAETSPTTHGPEASTQTKTNPTTVGESATTHAKTNPTSASETTTTQPKTNPTTVAKVTTTKAKPDPTTVSGTTTTQAKTTPTSPKTVTTTQAKATPTTPKTDTTSQAKTTPTTAKAVSTTQSKTNPPTVKATTTQKTIKPVEKNITDLAPKVEVSFTLDAVFADIPDIAAFIDTVRAQLAQMMKVNAQRIENLIARQGSIIVSFDLMPPSNSSETTSSTAVNTLQSSIVGGTLDLKDTNGKVLPAVPDSLTVTAVTSTTETPTEGSTEPTVPVTQKPTVPTQTKTTPSAGIGPFNLSGEDAGILLVVLGIGLGVALLVLICVTCSLCSARRKVRRYKGNISGFDNAIEMS